MDPPLISEGSFSTANPSLAEIWPFNGGGRGGAIGDMNGLLGLRMGNGGGDGGGFGPSLMAGFVDGSGVVNHEGSNDESTVTEQSGSLVVGGGGRKRRAVGSEDESSKLLSATVATTNSGNDLKESVGKQMKLSGPKDENGVSNSGTEASSAGGSKPSEKNKQPTEPPKDYIHVRARRGQATDSHSLAERARREKISERMKMLQDLVPGCNKVIGKALVLDEIINYIQSLQRQVEFLSMKLEAVNSGINPAINGFPPKDPGTPVLDATGMMFGSQAGREYGPVMDTEWLQMHLGGAFDRAT